MGRESAPRAQSLRLVGAEPTAAPCVTPAASCEEDEWAALLSRAKVEKDAREEDEWAAQMARIRSEIEREEEREWQKQVERVKAQMALDEEREWQALAMRMRAPAPAAADRKSQLPEKPALHSMIAPKMPATQARTTLTPPAPEGGLRFTLPEEKAHDEAMAALKATPKLPPRVSATSLPRVSSPGLGARSSVVGPSPLRTTPQLARQSFTPRPSAVPARPVAKSALPQPAQRPEVARLLARGNKRDSERPRAPAQSGVHRVSQVQGAPAQAQAKKKDSSLVELSRSLESSPPAPPRASRNLPPAPPRSSWSPQASVSEAALDAAANEAAKRSEWPSAKTMRGPAIAPAQPAPAPAPEKPVTRSGKAPLRLPPLPPRGQASSKPRPQLPPIPSRKSRAPAKGLPRPSQPLAIPAPPPRSAASRDARTGFAHSVWSAVASFTNRGGAER